MKKRFMSIICVLFSLFLIAQDTKPSGSNLKALTTPNNPSFHYFTTDSTLWVFKGTYGWTKLAGATKFQSKIDSLAINGWVQVQDTLDYYVMKSDTVSSDGYATVHRLNGKLDYRTFGTAANSATTDFAPSSGSANYVQVSPSSAQTGNINMTGTATFSSTVQGTTAKLTNLTDNYIPYHISDASGLGNSKIIIGSGGSVDTPSSYGTIRMFTSGFQPSGTTRPVGNFISGITFRYEISDPYESQIGFGTADDMYIRYINNGSVGSWKKVWHSGNSNTSGVNWAANNVVATGTVQGTTAKLTNLTDNYIPKHISDGSGLGNSIVFDNGTNVGIGISSGSELTGNKLAVDGSVYASSFKRAGGTSAQYLLADGSVTTTAGSVYKGEIDGATGSGLEDGTGTAGWYYACSSAGTFDYGSGDITLDVGDQLYYNGTIWLKVPGAGSYTLPVATDELLGGVIIGDGIYVDEFGTISVSMDYDSLTNKPTTSDIAEGTNLYYTEERVSANTDVVANTAKVTNATHTGDATGATELTLATVNSNIGTYNNVTINAKGLATAGSNIDYLVDADIADKVDKEDGYSLVADTSIVKIHDPESDNQNISTSGAVGNITISSGSTLNLNVNDHSNRAALDLVSGTNTGDQDLSGLKLISDSTTSTGYTRRDRLASELAKKQNKITLGSTSQYFRGDFSLATFPTNVSSFTNDAEYISNDQEIDPSIYSWAKASTKPSYTWTEIGSKPALVTIADAQTITGAKTFNAGITIGAGQALNGHNSDSRDKIRVWNSNAFTIGMGNGYSFGGLNDYAMTFQMSNNDARGWWWGDTNHTNDQGAMSLTTKGLLSLAGGMRIGYGESDVTAPTANTLAVSGVINATGSVTADAFVGDGSDLTGIDPANVNQTSSYRFITDTERNNFGKVKINGDSNWGSLASTDFIYSSGQIYVDVDNTIIDDGSQAVSGSAVYSFVTDTIDDYLLKSGGTVTGDVLFEQKITADELVLENGTHDWSIIADTDLEFKRNGVEIVFGTAGTITAPSIMTASNFQLSDKRLKENVSKIDLTNLDKVEWVQYEMINDSTNTKRYGVIAQDLEDIMPQFITTNTDEAQTKSVNYIDLLVAKIAELENRIKQLENEK